jgi:DNA-binding transcriptional regulator YiaG
MVWTNVYTRGMMVAGPAGRALEMERAVIASGHPTYTLKPGELRHDLRLSRERMARLVDVSAKTVERWEQQQTLPSNPRVRGQLAQIQAVRDLGLIVYKPEGFQLFLQTPLPHFGGRTPLQMIEQGDAERVLDALAADYEGLGA